MKKIVLALMLVLCLTGLAYGDVYMSPLTVQDVEQGFTNYCWAASASDTLAASGWTNSAYPTAQAIYIDITSNFANSANAVSTAWYWYIQQNFPYIPISNLVGYADFTTLRQSLTDGYGISALIMPGVSVGHALTVWGENITGSTVNGLYVTDSADGYNGVKYEALSGNILSGEYAGYYIFNMMTLENYSNALPNYPPPTPPPPISSVPEPSAMLLFGSGLVGLIGLRRKSKR